MLKSGSSLFGNGGPSSVQPLDHQAVGGGASGEDCPHLSFIPALDGGIRSPLQVTAENRGGVT